MIGLLWKVIFVKKRCIKNGEIIIIKIAGFFLAISVLLMGFFEIDRIPIESYFGEK